jgi:hypothetical protein
LIDLVLRVFQPNHALGSRTRPAVHARTSGGIGCDFVAH